MPRLDHSAQRTASAPSVGAVADPLQRRMPAYCLGTGTSERANPSGATDWAPTVARTSRPRERPCQWPAPRLPPGTGRGMSSCGLQVVVQRATDPLAPTNRSLAMDSLKRLNQLVSRCPDGSARRGSGRRTRLSYGEGADPCSHGDLLLSFSDTGMIRSERHRISPSMNRSTNPRVR
jgi:hypothetical protein